MRDGDISSTLFIVILLVFLVNVIISTANVFEDGALLRRVIPAACWVMATMIWIASYLIKNHNIWQVIKTILDRD